MNDNAEYRPEGELRTSWVRTDHSKDPGPSSTPAPRRALRRRLAVTALATSLLGLAGLGLVNGQNSFAQEAGGTPVNADPSASTKAIPVTVDSYLQEKLLFTGYSGTDINGPYFGRKEVPSMGMGVSIGHAEAPGTIKVVATDPTVGGVILESTVDIGATATSCLAQAKLSEDGSKSMSLKCY